ncbi:glycerate kinase [Microlunatus soli]|uniref:Glycerate kinase n=1 Tax=Microlunatus soli TaxID=630515 RepID=A0A1H1PR50_9ACTN|nr:glycerate kinase [Microlunatus soli]SDS13553.1 glycerate kinase [Microlunatus soli]
MRVIIATDAIGALRSARAGAVLADAWSGAETTVVPIGEAGAGFARAVADQVEVEPSDGVSGGGLTTVVDTPERLLVSVEPPTGEPQLGIDRDASSAALGIALAEALAASPYHAPEVVLDVSANRAHDAGAGLLGALGATANVALDAGVAGLHGVSRVDLRSVRQLLGGRRVTLVVPPGQQGLPLLGLRGITSRFGRDQGWHPELLLATDASLQAFTVAAAPGERETEDWGAAGGLGFVADLLGGRVVTGSAYCAELAGLPRVIRGADLLVTGCSVFDFAERGGGVVARIARLGESSNVPVILIAGEVVIGSREMRSMGIESAYGVRESRVDQPVGDVAPVELAATVNRVARSWTW